MSYNSLDEMFTALRTKRVAAIVHDAPLPDYYASTRGREAVQGVGPLLRPEKYGIALPTGSELREPINRALLRLPEAGEFERLTDRWFR